MKTVYRHSKALDREFQGVDRLLQREKKRRQEAEERIAELETKTTAVVPPESNVILKVLPQKDGTKHLHIEIDGKLSPLYASAGILYTE